MSGRTLSNGTLGLRFMQNAQRAKQLKEEELIKAKVKDDAEWEISKEIRDTWTPTTDSTQSVTHEASYLPFLFPSSSQEATSTTKINGRRAFNNGKEAELPPPAPATSHSDTPPETKKGVKGSAANRPIAKTGASKESKKSKNKDLSKSARAAIFDTSGVGTDLVAERPPSAPKPASPPVFLKPAGVDEPSTSSDVIQGARKTKRGTSDGAESPKKKKHKSG